MDKGVKSLGIILCNIEINPRSIKDEHLRQGRINGLTDRLNKIGKQMEYILNKKKKVLFEAYKQRGCPLIENKELAKSLTEIKKKG